MEFVVELVSAVLRGIFEALFSTVFDRIARLIGFIYDVFFQTVRWNLNSDFLATPITILLMLALAGGAFLTAVKAIQWIVT